MTNSSNINLGKSGPQVFPLALGCMGTSDRSMYGSSDEAESIATIHAALDRGTVRVDDFESFLVRALGAKLIPGWRRRTLESAGPGVAPSLVEKEARVVSDILKQRKAGRTLAEIAEDLNGRGIEGKRGGRWHPSTVRYLIQRQAA